MAEVVSTWHILTQFGFIRFYPCSSVFSDLLSASLSTSFIIRRPQPLFIIPPRLLGRPPAEVGLRHRLHLRADHRAPRLALLRLLVEQGRGAGRAALVRDVLHDERVFERRAAHHQSVARLHVLGRLGALVVTFTRNDDADAGRREMKELTSTTGGQPTLPSAALRRRSTYWRPNRSQARCTPDSPGSPGRPRRRTGYSAPKANRTATATSTL